MAYIAFKPTDYFNPKLFSGTAAAQSITGVGFQPTFVWGKSSVSNNHQLLDAVRGTGNPLESDTSDIQASDPGSSLSSFDADGFSLAGNSAFNPSGTNNVISWNWKMGTTTGLSGGTITPSSYSIDATRKQGIYKWDGTSSTGTIAHGLGKAPDIIITKSTTNNQEWEIYSSVAANPTTERLQFTDSSIGGSSTAWNSTAPTSTLFSIGSGTEINGTGRTYVAYAYAGVPGYSHFTKYIGTGVAAGPFIDCGFAPAFVMVKVITYTGAWVMWDNRRPGHDQIGRYYQANSNSAEDDNTTNFGAEFTSTGFRVVGVNNSVNMNNETYLVMAFAQTPLIGSDGTPATSWLGTV